jgi:hypothetical protein
VGTRNPIFFAAQRSVCIARSSSRRETKLVYSRSHTCNVLLLLLAIFVSLTDYSWCNLYGYIIRVMPSSEYFRRVVGFFCFFAAYLWDDDDGWIDENFMYRTLSPLCAPAWHLNPLSCAQQWRAVLSLSLSLLFLWGKILTFHFVYCFLFCCLQSHYFSAHTHTQTPLDQVHTKEFLSPLRALFLL